MAVTKIWAIHDSVSRVVDYCTNPSKTKLSDLEQVLLYAADKEKTLDEGEQQYAVTGIGCRAESAAREMAAVQRRFGKAGGNVAYHAYQSFKTGEVTAEECHRIGVETARRLWGNDRQVLIATHFNTGTYHNHFVVNHPRIRHAQNACGAGHVVEDIAAVPLLSGVMDNEDANAVVISELFQAGQVLVVLGIGIDLCGSIVPHHLEGIDEYQARGGKFP